MRRCHLAQRGVHARRISDVCLVVRGPRPQLIPSRVACERATPATAQPSATSSLYDRTPQVSRPEHDRAPLPCRCVTHLLAPVSRDSDDANPCCAVGSTRPELPAAPSTAPRLAGTAAVTSRSSCAVRLTRLRSRRVRECGTLRPPRARRDSPLGLLAALARGDQDDREDCADDRKARPDEEGTVEAFRERDRRVHAPAQQPLGAAVGDRRENREADAPPTCWEVLISPEARPASCGLVPVTAPIVTETNENPRPKAASSDGPSTSAPNDPPGAGTCENQSRPPAISNSPAIRTGLKPMRVTSCEPTPAEMMIPTQAADRRALS